MKNIIIGMVFGLCLVIAFGFGRVQRGGERGYQWPGIAPGRTSELGKNPLEGRRRRAELEAQRMGVYNYGYVTQYEFHVANEWIQNNSDSIWYAIEALENSTVEVVHSPSGLGVEERIAFQEKVKQNRKDAREGMRKRVQDRIYVEMKERK